MRGVKLAITLIALLVPASLFAGDMANFETAMRSAYSDYRTALFATNTGKAEIAAKSLARFSTAWTKLSAEATPPQYEDDPQYGATMKAVGKLATKAADAITAGKLPESHEILEHIRNQIGDMHMRAGLYGISDRMNAYHARMEKVIGNSGMNASAALAEAAILEYLIDDIIAHPPANADPSFATLTKDVKKSVETLKQAATSGKLPAVKSAIRGLKPPYAKMFVKFG